MGRTPRPLVICLMLKQDEEDESRRPDVLMDETDGESYVTPREALRRKEFYLLWLTRQLKDDIWLRLYLLAESSTMVHRRVNILYTRSFYKDDI